MQKLLTFEIVFKNSILLFGYSWYVLCLIKRESVAEKMLGMKDKKYGKIATVALGLALLFMFIKFTMPCIMDIPYLAKNEYSVVEGMAQDNSKEEHRATATRAVTIQTKEQDAIRIKIAGGTGDIKEGDWLKVMYLPNSHYGCVVKHEEK